MRASITGICSCRLSVDSISITTGCAPSPPRQLADVSRFNAQHGVPSPCTRSRIRPVHAHRSTRTAVALRSAILSADSSRWLEGALKRGVGGSGLAHASELEHVQATRPVVGGMCGTLLSSACRRGAKAWPRLARRRQAFECGEMGSARNRQPCPRDFAAKALLAKRVFVTPGAGLVLATLQLCFVFEGGLKLLELPGVHARSFSVFTVRHCSLAPAGFLRAQIQPQSTLRHDKRRSASSIAIGQQECATRNLPPQQPFQKNSPVALAKSDWTVSATVQPLPLPRLCPTPPRVHQPCANCCPNSSA